MYAGVLLLQGLVNTFATSKLGLMGDVSVWFHTLGLAVFTITLATVAPTHQPASYVFQTFVPDNGAYAGGLWCLWRVCWGKEWGEGEWGECVHGLVPASSADESACGHACRRWRRRCGVGTRRHPLVFPLARLRSLRLSVTTPSVRPSLQASGTMASCSFWGCWAASGP